MANMITSELFGKTADGEDVTRYILSNSKGIKVKILNYGGTITSIEVPDKDGNIGDVILGCDNMDDHLKQSCYFGALVGRFANRIAKGQFTLEGEKYQLCVNNGPNALHGGEVGFDKRIWNAKIKGDRLVLVLVSPDGEENYPGTLKTKVSYSLDGEGCLKLEYKATTDKTTILNLTSHGYFNLAGHDSNHLDDHVMTMNAESYLPVDSTNIPTGEVKSVADTDFDLRAPVRLGNRLANMPQGFDHCFCVGENGTMKFASRVEHPPTGRYLECHTTEPSIQLYTAYYVNGVKGKAGATYGPLSAFTLEAQHYPDSINQPDFPSVVLKPGETYKQTTLYKFGLSTPLQ